MKKRFSTLNLWFAIISFFICCTATAQIQSANSGFWTVPATWVGGVVPTSADNVIINGGHNVNNQNATINFSSLTILANGTLTSFENPTLNGGPAGITNHGTIVFTVGGANRIQRLNANITNKSSGVMEMNGGLITSDVAGTTITNDGGVMNLNFVGNSIGNINILNKAGGQVNKTNTNLNFPGIFTNETGGTVTVGPSGSLTFNNSLVNSGIIDVSGTVVLSGGSHQFNSGNSFGGTGTLNLLGNITVTAPTGFLPAFTIINQGANNNVSAMNIAAGANTFMIVPSGTTFTQNENSSITGFTKLDNLGTMIFTAGGAGRTKFLDCNLNNKSSGIVNFNNGFVTSNVAGTLITNEGELNLNIVGNSIGNIDIVNKAGGQVNKTNTNLNFPGIFTNETGGTVTVGSSGSLTFTNSLVNSGIVDVSGTMVLSGGSHQFNSGNSFGGTGTLNLLGNITVTAPTGFLPAFTIINQGVNNNLSLMNIAAGANTFMIVPSGTTFTQNENSSITGFTKLDNLGTMIFTAGGAGRTKFLDCNLNNKSSGIVNFNNGFVTSNVAGTLITNEGELNLNIVGNSIGNISILNKIGGQVNKTNTNLNFPGIFTNETGGTVTVGSSGSLTFTNSLVNSGIVDVSGTMVLSGGSHQFNSGNSFGGTGILNLFGNITVTSAGGFVLSFTTINHGVFNNLTSTTLNGEANTSLTIAAGSSFNSYENTTIAGFADITNNGTMSFFSGGANRTKYINNNISIGNTGIINLNHGAITSSVPGTTITNNGGTLNLKLPLFSFSNIDVVNKTGGQVTKDGANLYIGASFTNEAGGTVTVTNGSGLTFSGISVNNGLIENFGTFSNIGFMKGVGNFTGNITNNNASTLSPGLSPGCMTYQNNVSVLGNFVIEVSGLTPCTLHDRITVAGAATIGGNLAVSFTAPFPVTQGDVVTIIDATERSGTFSSVNPALPPNWELVYDFPNTGQVSLRYVVPSNGTAPTITCPQNIVVSNDAGQCGAYVSFTGSTAATATGTPTPTITYSLASGSLFPVGTTTVTARATNDGGFEECTFNVTVNDTEAPDAKCKPANVTLVNGTASITAADVNNNSIDNCSIVLLSVSPSVFNCENIGENEVTLTVTDASGNSNTCKTTVTVAGEKPTCTIASIPANNTYTGGVSTNLYIGYGPQSTTLQVNAPESGAPYTYSWSGGTLSNYNTASPVFTASSNGQHTFTVQVTNKFGCTSTCSITICVTDIREYKNGKLTGKVNICHLPPGNIGNVQTISVGVDAVPAHIELHGGDKLGTCEQQPCSGAGEERLLRSTNKSGQVDQSELLQLAVFPNPSRGQFTLRINGMKAGKAQLQILNNNGSVMEQRSVRINALQQTLSIDLSRFSSGLYSIKLLSEQGVRTAKIILRK